MVQMTDMQAVNTPWPRGRRYGILARDRRSAS